MHDGNLVNLLARLIIDFLWLLDLKRVIVGFTMFLHYLEKLSEKLLVFFDEAIFLSPPKVHLEDFFEIVRLYIELPFVRSIN